MRPRSLLWLGVGLLLLAALAWWGLARPGAPWSPVAGAQPGRPGAAPAPGRSVAPGEPGAEAPPGAGAALPPHEPHGAAPSTESGAPGPALPSAPLSDVPHRVLRGWNAAQGKTMGIDLVVEPTLPTRALEQLARDALAHNADADVLSVDIYDSEEAATYDRHRDGGALAERHRIARVRRHRALGFESVQVRGVEIAP